MKKKEEGFTLLELLIAVLLLSIFLASVWQLFSIAYLRYHQNQVRMELDNSARNVAQFIQNEVRKADTVRITTDAGVINPIMGAADNINVSGNLVKIELQNGVQSYSLEIQSTGTDKKKGIYTLQYVTTESGAVTRIPISDLIQELKATRSKDSDEVSFYCELNRQNEKDDILKIKLTFTESLAYKEKCTP